MSLVKFQKQARVLQNRSKEMQIKMSYRQALELIATQNGFKTWNALKETKEKTNNKESVLAYWETKGIDYESINKLIDLYPEGHDISETAKDLVSLLDDYSFEESNKKSNIKKPKKIKYDLDYQTFFQYDTLTEIGNERDSDVYARMCGLSNNSEVCQVIINKGKSNQLTLSLCSAGEQRISIETEDEKIDDLVNDANKEELYSEENRKIMLKLLEQNKIDFSMNSWYEARITYKSIDDRYESELGLEGVWDSVKSFLDYFNDKENRESYINWLEEYDGDI